MIPEEPLQLTATVAKSRLPPPVVTVKDTPVTVVGAAGLAMMPLPAATEAGAATSKLRTIAASSGRFISRRLRCSSGDPRLASGTKRPGCGP